MPSPISSLSLPAQRPEDGPRAAARRLDLDVVRGVAIVLALGWHFSREASGNPVVDVLQWPGHAFGWAGVDLFFVLSGFLMGQLVLKERARTGAFDGRRFTARRLLRLWPVLYVFLAVHAVLGQEPLGSYLWQNAFHVQNYAGTSLAHPGPSPSRSTSTSCSPSSFRCSPAAAVPCARSWPCSWPCWSVRWPCAASAS
jgi:peptidoglycan/LPS O-acetylase OafA/YrhL